MRGFSHPTARAFGMTMAVLPTVVAYVWLAVHWLGRAMA